MRGSNSFLAVLAVLLMSTAPVPQKYRSSVIYHFLRNERKAGASFR